MYPQRVGRQKHVLDIEFHFNDGRRGGGINRGRGRPRGGPNTAGERGDQRGDRRGPNRNNRVDRQENEGNERPEGDRPSRPRRDDERRERRVPYVSSILFIDSFLNHERHGSFFQPFRFSSPAILCLTIF